MIIEGRERRGDQTARYATRNNAWCLRRVWRRSTKGLKVNTLASCLESFPRGRASTLACRCAGALCRGVSLSAAVKRVGRARRITQTSIRLPISVKNYFTPSSAWTKAPKRTRGETRERERIYILLFSYLKFRFLSILFSVNRCSFLARVQKLKQ